MHNYKKLAVFALAGIIGIGGPAASIPVWDLILLPVMRGLMENIRC